MQSLTGHLESLNACGEARAWAAQHTTLADAWDACERADWLLWYAARRGTDRKLLVRAACACARTALPRVPPGEDRPRLAIETAERWCDGSATLEEVRSAAADATYAASAAYAATYATYAAYAAAYADADAAAYAAAYADAAADADADAARHQSHLTMCPLVRSVIPCPTEP